MSKSTNSPTIPQSVPKLEAELVRDQYDSLRRRKRDEDRDGRATGTRSPARLTNEEKRDLRERLLDVGVSKATLVALELDRGERDP